jgi:diphosphomevalonate decarboxylase
MNWVEASAPSNIALIKYMGKVETKLNRPTNSSLSYSLEKLRTFVRLRQSESLTEDRWAPFERSDLLKIQLSEKGRAKFLTHFEVLKKEFKLKGFFEIESANNFPADCGLASSASSFAALTLAVHDWAVKNAPGVMVPYRPKELSKLSQRGSGSSCRSFFTPWALWHQEGAEAMQFPYQGLKHQVILCDQNVKEVSSSEAHIRVTTSDLFKGRPERAEERLKHLVQALREQQWKAAYQITWNEFWDMHMLFHTANPPFMYMNDVSFRVLKELNEYWNTKADGPLITMDAGSNVHLLFRPDQKSHYFEMINRFRDVASLWTDEGYLERL